MDQDEGPAAIARPGLPAFPDRYLALTVTGSSEAAEAAAAALHAARTGGVVEETAPPGRMRLRAYLPAGARQQAALAHIRARLAALPALGLGQEAPVLEVEEVDAQAWEILWKADLRPFRVGRLWIAPPWEAVAPGRDERVLRIEPGMAFGSGLHASTQLCLRLLDECIRPGVTVVDVGTGSGILAVASALLGAARVIAIDDDPIAVGVAHANAAQNQVGERVALVVGDLLRPVAARADLILANLTADLHQTLAPQLPACLAADGAVIASGIVAPRLDDVRAAFAQAGLAILREEAAEEWRAVVVSGAAGPRGPAAATR